MLIQVHILVDEVQKIVAVGACRITDTFPSLQQKGARLGYGLICNHAFVDGNKRIGAHAILLFLALNGIELEYTQEELSDMVLNVASGTLRFEDMVKWIIKHQA